MQHSGERLIFLDGLRGIGAAQVCLQHLTQWFGVAGPFGLVSIVFDGGLAVFIFFLISGFVLASAYARPRSPAIAIVAGRATRLFLPCLCSGLLSIAIWLLLYPIEPLRLGVSTYGSSGFSALWPALAETLFITPVFGQPDSSLFIRIPWVDGLIKSQPLINPVLWTIHIEFIGSLVVLALAIGKLRLKPLLFAALLAATSIFFVRSLIMPFVVGFALYHYRPSTDLPYRSWIALSLLCLGALLSVQASNHQYLGFFESIARIGFTLQPQSTYSIQKAAAATLIFCGILISPLLQAILAKREFQILGRASFPIYLTHLPLVYFLYVGRDIIYPLTGFPLWLNQTLNVAVYLVLLVVAVSAFKKLDEYFITKGRRVTRFVAKTPSTPSNQIVMRRPLTTYDETISDETR